jgi:hypothetical protein
MLLVFRVPIDQSTNEIGMIVEELKLKGVGF